MSFFERAGISVYRAGKSSEMLLSIDNEGSEFKLDEPGVYSVEGDNQSGKSLLIKAVLSVDAEVLDIASRGMVLDGQTVQAGDYAEVLKGGVVAVFQDDALMPSMTVQEQILLRHSSPTIRTLWAYTCGLLHIDSIGH